MALKADVINGELQYNYTDNSKKENVGSDLGYDQFLQLLCAEMQYQDPLEPTNNRDYVAQLATFSQLEATLSLNDTQDSQFANNLVGKQVILKVENNGSTSYVDGKVDYVLYENGKVKLSVNNSLYDLADLDTIADSDYYEAVAMSKSFQNMLGSLPEAYNLSLSYKTAIQQVRDFYDGMSDYQKGFISDDDLALLRGYESRIESLEKSQETESETDTQAEEV